LESGKSFGELKKDDEYTALKAAVENAIGTERHERFGATLTEGEQGNSVNFMPDFKNDTAATLITKMETFLSIAQRSRANKFDNVLGKGVYEKLSGESIPTGIPGLSGGSSSSASGKGLDEIKARWGVGGSSSSASSKGGEETISQGTVGNYYKSLGSITQDFNTPVSAREDGGLYDRSTVVAWGGTHKGLDVAVPTGTDIKVPFEGEVIEADFTPGWGGTVVVKDRNGAEHRFSHLSKLAGIQKGTKIAPGTVIAKSGGGKKDKGRGNSTGSHLDYRIKLNGKYVDPLTYNS
jgi:murein DD-endopeptidase MepM/ murein hydrolase activator NlpD